MSLIAAPYTVEMMRLALKDEVCEIDHRLLQSYVVRANIAALTLEPVELDCPRAVADFIFSVLGYANMVRQALVRANAHAFESGKPVIDSMEEHIGHVSEALWRSNLAPPQKQTTKVDVEGYALAAGILSAAMDNLTLAFDSARETGKMEVCVNTTLATAIIMGMMLLQPQIAVEMVYQLFTRSSFFNSLQLKHLEPAFVSALEKFPVDKTLQSIVECHASKAGFIYKAAFNASADAIYNTYK